MTTKLYASLIAVYVIWGSTYLAMGIAVVELPPLLMAAVRFAAAGGVLLALALRAGAKIPAARDWVRMLPIGALMFLGGNGFISIAEQTVPSGGAAVVAAMMPLWVGVLGRFFGETATVREWISLVIGFAGVVVLMGGPSLEIPHQSSLLDLIAHVKPSPLATWLQAPASGPTHTSHTSHVVLLMFAPIAWALGSLLARKTKDVGGTHATLVGPALQMLTGGAALLAVAMVRGERWPEHASTEAYVMLVYLWSVGSIVGFTAYAYLLTHARPVVATSYAYVNPILAVFLGAALRHEPLGWTTIVAIILIVTAVILALQRPRTSVPSGD